jgi:hypothetical protein
MLHQDENTIQYLNAPAQLLNKVIRPNQKLKIIRFRVHICQKSVTVWQPARINIIMYMVLYILYIIKNYTYVTFVLLHILHQF